MTRAEMSVEGLRVKLKHFIDVFPLATFPAGLVGTVCNVDTRSTIFLHVRLDMRFTALAEWDNCLQVGPVERRGEFASSPEDWEALA